MPQIRIPDCYPQWIESDWVFSSRLTGTARRYSDSGSLASPPSA